MKATGARIAAVAGVVALVVAVAALSIAALQQGRPGTQGNTIRPAPTFDFGDGTTTASPTPADPPTAPVGAATEERFLAIDGERLWRATAGSCSGAAPVVELSIDGGSTWTDVTPPDAAQVLGAAALPDVAGEIVAATGDDCAPMVLRTYTSGVEWDEYPRALGDTTFRAPSGNMTIVAPGDDLTAPCSDARSVRASRGVVGLVCEGTAFALLDNSWTQLTDHAITLDAVAGTVVVAHSSAACNGIAVTRFTGTVGDEMTCFDDADPSEPAAISSLDGDLVLWSADLVLTP